MPRSEDAKIPPEPHAGWNYEGESFDPAAVETHLPESGIRQPNPGRLFLGREAGERIPAMTRSTRARGNRRLFRSEDLRDDRQCDDCPPEQDRRILLRPDHSAGPVRGSRRYASATTRISAATGNMWSSGRAFDNDAETGICQFPVPANQTFRKFHTFSGFVMADIDDEAPQSAVKVYLDNHGPLNVVGAKSRHRA